MFHILHIQKTKKINKNNIIHSKLQPTVLLNIQIGRALLFPLSNGIYIGICQIQRAYDRCGIWNPIWYTPSQWRDDLQVLHFVWYPADRFFNMMTSSNENIFRVTGHLCGEFTGPGEFPTQRPVTRSFDVYFDLCPNKRLSKQWWGWWFETLSCSLWRHRNDIFHCRWHGDQ